MSVFQFIANAPLPITKRITDSNVTMIADATNNTVFVPWFQVNENAGSTAALTVDIYDGTNAVYLGDDTGLTWNAKTVTASNSYRFTQGLVIPKGSVLRVKSGDVAGKFHVHGVYVNVTG